jgi:hypothetical protein
MPRKGTGVTIQGTSAVRNSSWVRSMSSIRLLRGEYKYKYKYKYIYKYKYKYKNKYKYKYKYRNSLGQDRRGGLCPLPGHHPQQLAGGQHLQLVVDRGAEVLVYVGVVVPG